MEQALTKEQIVGVWRSGDYWASFSEDGFMCGYLSGKCIVEGGYEVLQDQVIVASDFFENDTTTFKVTGVTDKALECDIKYSEIEIQPIDYADSHYNQKVTLSEAKASMAFTKSQEQPTARENEIVEKIFEFYNIYDLNPNIINWSGYNYEKQNHSRCHNIGRFHSDGSMDRTVTKLDAISGSPEFPMHMRDFYVYLAPYVYLIELHNEKEYSIESLLLMLHPYDVQKMKASLDPDGRIVLTEQSS